MHDGYIVRGHRHHDCIRTARSIPRYGNIKGLPDEKQGFITSKNRFVDRREGLNLQKKAGIPSAAIKYGDDYRSKLYSEDLY